MKAPQALIRSSVIAFLLIGASALPMRAAVNRWTNLGPRSEAVVNALARDPSFPDTIYAATVGGGVFKTGDGGETWGPINNGLDDGYVTALAVDPAATGTVYAATTYAGVFKTTDGGKTWRPAVLRDSFLTALAIDPGQPSRLYAGTESGLIYRTTDGAATWTLAFPSTAAVSSIVVSPDSTAYTTTRFGVVYRSSDGGDHWNQLNTGFQRQFPYVINASLANDPSNPQTVYVVLDTTMFKTTDGGNTWSPLDGPGGHVCVTSPAAGQESLNRGDQRRPLRLER